jgi:glycerate 2-kinase
MNGIHPETPKPDDPLFYGTLNILAGTNQVALSYAKEKAAELGYYPYIINSELAGDVETTSELLINTVISFRNNAELKKPVCLLFGGETTVKVSGNGLGGRNQHLALSAAIRLAGLEGVTILAAGTDGTDGPTDAAGAVVDAETLNKASVLKEDPVDYLSKFNSYNFFRRIGGQIITGPTFTNVMDLIVVLVE